MKRIFTAERALGIGSTGAMLIGRGQAGEWVVGIPVKTPNSVRWTRQGVSKTDWKRLEAAAQSTEGTP